MSFREYAEYGWHLCGISPGNKGPTGSAAKDWQKREKAITDPAVAARLMGAGLCHAWSGTCALDIDNFEVAEAYLAEKGIDLRGLLMATDSVQISSGRPGRYKLLYALPEPLPSKQLAPYKAISKKTGKPETYHGFELRCGNKHGDTVQDVLPPTIHPDTGRPYEWVYGDDLCGDWRRLPAIPSDLLALWQDALGSEAAHPVGPVAASGTSSRELEEFLAGRDPDAAYGPGPGSWLETAAALHHETRGSAEGFALFDAWSARGSKYKGRDDTAAKWRSFRLDAPNAVTIGTLRQQHVASVSAFPVVEPPAAAPDSPADAATVSTAMAEKEGYDAVRDLLEPRLVFVPGQERYFDMATRGEAWLSDRSLRHMFCPMMPTIATEGKDGKPKTLKPDPVIFMQNSRTKKVADAVGIHPGAGRLYEEDGQKFVNRYWPRKIEPLKPLPFEEEAFLFLWSRMKDPVFQRWLMKFFAHAVQKPGVKIQTAPLLYSAETGTGKNTICHVIPQLLFGERWVRTISGAVLGGQFNDTVGETWWLYLEELRAGSNKADRVALTNKLKAWITDSMIEVHPKGLKPFNIRNRVQVTATSNFDDAIHLDNNDRRWAVCELGDSLTEDEARNVYHFLQSERAPGVLRHIFLNTDLTGFNPTARAPSTMAKVCMIRASIGAWESTLVEHMVQGSSPFHRDMFTMKDAYEALRGIGGPSSQMALRNVLTKAPFNCVQLPNHRSVRYYAWRNATRWAAQPESARIRHVETGIRPMAHVWSDDIPASILAMSADGVPDKPVCDLI